MSRRFTLFAILAAACLLFVSCGGLFTSSSTEITFGKTKSDTKPVASTTTSIRIPLPSRTQRTAMDPSAPNTPLELCDSYKFTLKSTDDEYSAAADADDQFIEFPEVEYGTYTITATAYGKLGDGKTTAIANYSQKKITVNSSTTIITVKFTLTEDAKIYLYGYTGTPVTNADGSTTQPTYAGKDGKTLLSEKTTSSDGRTETEISYAVDLETGENTTDAQGNPVVTKTVVTETRASGGEKVTTTEFSLNETEEGCSKRITIEEGTKTTVKKYDDNSSDESQPTSMEVTEKDAASGTTTVTKYDNGDWDHPASITVIENTQKTTTTYDESGKESETLDTIIIEITAGQNAGQKTIQKYDTNAAGNPKTEETVISADRTAVVSSDYDTVGGTVSAQKETYYAAGYDYEHPDSNANALLKNKEIEYTVSDGARTGKTETTFNYTAGLTTAKDFDGTPGIVPVAKTVENVYSISEGNATLTGTKTTEYVYTSGRKSKETVTETTAGQEANVKTTTTEYNLNQASENCVMRVTVAQGNTTTVSRYAANAENPENATPVEKDETTVTGGVETTKYFTSPDMTKPSSKVETSSSTRTTTEYLSSNKDKTNKVTEVILTGENAGQTTETVYDTDLNKASRITVTSPDDHKTISTLDYSVADKVTTTTYQTDWNPDTDSTGTNPNSYNVSKIIETTASSTKTTEYTRDSGATTASEPHYDKDGQLMAPFTQTKVTVENGSATTITTTNYNFGLYGETGSEILKPTTMIETEEDGAGNIIATHETTFDYNDPYGRIKEVKRDGVTTEKWIYQAYTCKVYARKETIPTTLTLDYCKNYGNSNVIFYVPSDDKNALKIDALTTSATALEDAGKQFLTDNFVLCGNSGEKADLYWAKTTSDGKDVTISGDNDRLRSKTIKEGEGDNLYPVIYKADQALFETKHSDCIRLTVDTENQIVYCIIHNDKGSCSNFWGSYTTYLINDENGTPINFGSTGNKQGAGGN